MFLSFLIDTQHRMVILPSDQSKGWRVRAPECYFQFPAHSHTAKSLNQSVSLYIYLTNGDNACLPPRRIVCELIDIWKHWEVLGWYVLWNSRLIPLYKSPTYIRCLKIIHWARFSLHAFHIYAVVLKDHRTANAILLGERWLVPFVPFLTATWLMTQTLNPMHPPRAQLLPKFLLQGSNVRKGPPGSSVPPAVEGNRVT